VPIFWFLDNFGLELALQTKNSEKEAKLFPFALSREDA